MSSDVRNLSLQNVILLGVPILLWERRVHLLCVQSHHCHHNKFASNNSNKGLGGGNNSKGLDSNNNSKGLDSNNSNKGLDSNNSNKGLDSNNSNKGLDSNSNSKGLDSNNSNKGLDSNSNSKKTRVNVCLSKSFGKTKASYLRSSLTIRLERTVEGLFVYSYG